MKNVSTGFGLCVAAAAALAYPFVSSLAPNANAVGVGTTALTAVAAAATSPATKAAAGVSVVGYWVNPDTARCTQGDPDTNGGFAQTHVRLWSNGRVEIRRVVWDNANLWVPNQWQCREELEFAPQIRSSQWFEVPNSTDGMACAPDINGDRFVDGDDLGVLLAAWGPTPVCPPFPNISCPLTLSGPVVP